MGKQVEREYDGTIRDSSVTVRDTESPSPPAGIKHTPSDHKARIREKELYAGKILEPIHYSNTHGIALFSTSNY